MITNKFEGMDMDTLRETADNLRDKLGSGVVVLANVVDDKVNFVVTATKDVLDKGIHSGNIVREVAKIAGGKVEEDLIWHKQELVMYLRLTKL